MRKHSGPIVKNDWLIEDAHAKRSNGIQIGSRRWVAWLANHSRFIFEGSSGHFSARCERRRGIPYWYAYRRVGSKLYKLYLGKADELTRERLERISARFTAPKQLPSHTPAADSTDWIAVLNQPPAAATISDKTTSDLSYLPLTKVHPPALPQGLVARARLTQRICGPITLLIAPSGFGKSTLLNEWRQTCGIPVVWVSLDADDNQPLRFWSAVIAALQTIYRSLGQDLQAPLRTATLVSLSEFVVGLTNAIIRASAAQDLKRLGIVLDDLHHIQDTRILSSLQTWLEHLPPTLQFVISSHTRPALAWGHLRARGMVAELNMDDLRFTMKEGIAYLSQHRRGEPLAYGEMQAIIQRTEGWAAGLALATLALDQPSEPSQPIAALSGARNFLREYFLETVVNRQPPSVQLFLFKTAILKHLCGPLCDAVTGQTDSAGMLEYLWRENLFLVRMEKPNWYRYHDLFAETLYDQLQQQLAAEIPRLHRRAAEWYRTLNAPDDAVYHLLAIEAWDEAASLIEEMVLRELEQFGDYSRLSRWLRQIPETVVQQHKTLLRVYARVAAFDFSRTEVKQFLTRVETNVTRKPIAERTSDEQSVLAEIRRIRELWITGDAGLAPLSEEGEHDDVWQMLDGMVSYARYVRRDIEKAEIVSRRLYEMARTRSHLYVMLITGGGLAHYALLRGHLRRAERIAREVLQQAIAQRGRLPESASVALTILSQVSYERNQLAQAHQLLLRAAEVDPNPTSSNMPIMEAIQRAKLEFAQGNVPAALTTLQAARELQSKYPAGLYRDRDLIAYQAWFAVRQGDCARAEAILAEFGTSEPHALATLVRAELLLKEEQPAAAVDLLEQLLKEYPQGLYLEPNLGARVVLALALFEQHQLNRARHAMTEAVRLAAPENFSRPFLDRGSHSVPLLTLVLRTSGLGCEAHAFTSQVLRQMHTAAGGTRNPLRSELTAFCAAASITPREQQVLRLLSSGLSNREIAAQLSFSETTVKTHLKNIYRKLGVNSRTRAVAQARTLELV